MAEKTGCETCRATFEAYGESPPCGGKGNENLEKCEWFNPPLWPENGPVYDIFRRLSGQHIMGPSGPVDLNLGPVFKMMELKGIDARDRERCIDLIQSAYRALIKR